MSNKKTELVLKTKVTVRITQTLKFKALIVEPRKEPYNVTVGGYMWKRGKGRKYEEQIFNLIRYKMGVLNTELLGLRGDA